MTVGQLVMALFVILGVAALSALLGLLLAWLFEAHPEAERDERRRVK